MSKSKKKENGEQEKNGTPTPPIPEVLKSVIGGRLDDQAGREALPTLMDLLLPKFADGKQVTEAGRITITPRLTHWEVKIDLPTYVRQCIVVPRSLVNSLEDLERAIVSQSVLWSVGYQRNKKKIPTLDDA